MAKDKLNNRIDIETIQRLQEASKRYCGDVGMVIDAALDALDRERALPITVEEKLGDMTAILGKLIDALAAKSEPQPQQPEVMTEQRLKWLLDKVLYISTASEVSARSSENQETIDAEYKRRKQATGL